MSSQQQTYDVVATRVFDAPVELVWRAWIEPELVKQWWGPAGFSVPLAEMDVREGGSSLVCMRAPAEWGGQDMYNTWNYRTVEPPKLLEFDLNFADRDGTTLNPADLGLPPGIPQDVRHVITFKPLDGRTEMTLTEYGYTTQQAHDTSLAGLEQVLDKMAMVVNKA